METRIDHITGGIYRISTLTDAYGITFNQFLIDDERPALIHTGEHGAYEAVRGAISEVLDPKTLAYVALLHWEGDENGGMERFLADAPAAELVGSALSIQLNAYGFGMQERVLGFQDGQTLDLGRHTLRFLETPHVHHWDSMMVFEETTQSLFPADLYLQPGDQPPLVSENLSEAMLEVYRAVGMEDEHRLAIHASSDPGCPIGRRIQGALDTLIGAAENAFEAELGRRTLSDVMRLIGPLG